MTDVDGKPIGECLIQKQTDNPKTQRFLLVASVGGQAAKNNYFKYHESNLDQNWGVTKSGVTFTQARRQGGRWVRTHPPEK